MSTLSGGTPNIDRPRNLQQQRKRAKDLLKAVRAIDAGAIARLGKFQIDADSAKLADAQLVVAREGGFESWPKLVKHLEQQETRAFKNAVKSGDAVAVRKFLTASPGLRKKINEPLFDYGGRAINAGAKHIAVVDVLLEFGADINLRSDWKAGPYGVLDDCPEDVARQLISRGAQLTAHAAARLGWLEELRRIVDANPKVVHEKGGDGQQPLHYSKTLEIADFLLDRGAEIDAKCVDHNSTAAQYALRERPEVTRRLLDRGALPDIFMAARFGDVTLARQLIDENPNCVAARINVKGYDRVPVFGIYCWVLGFYLSPHEVALNFKHDDLYELLIRHSSPKIRLLDAAMRNDEPAARAAVRNDSSLPSALTADEHSLIAHAVLQNRTQTVKLMLDLGFDPVVARGIDGGSVLHMAAWVGNAEISGELLKRGVEINTIDSTHGSSPLAWAAYGSVHRRQLGGDYARAIELLVSAGADIKAPGNKFGATMLGMAEGNSEIQQVLRRLGAT